MSLQSALFHLRASASDYKRNRVIPLPAGVTECRNIRYGSHGDCNLLDVYYPDDTVEALPTIVHIHGGGYVYGSKELYRRYGMDMARRGFAFVNFNYRLAPKWKFPTPLWDTDAVMEWICRNAARYHLDPKRILLAGDSAGAQLASQYAAIVCSRHYAEQFRMKVPDIIIRAVNLNCGIYDLAANAVSPRKGLALDYLGKALPDDDKRLKVLDAIDANYPPTFLTTARNDFLRENAEPMCELLRSRGVRAEWKCYGDEADKRIGHVFHVNILLPEAVRCNDDAAAFFRDALGK